MPTRELLQSELVLKTASDHWRYSATEDSREHLERCVTLARDAGDLGWLVVKWQDYEPSLRDIWAFSLAWHDMGEAPERVSHIVGSQSLGLGIVPAKPVETYDL